MTRPALLQLIAIAALSRVLCAFVVPFYRHSKATFAPSESISSTSRPRFEYPRFSRPNDRTLRGTLWARSSGEEDDDDEVSLKDDDWRAFRAKLVMGEKKTTVDPPVSSSSSSSTNTSGGAAGRSGTFIEGGVEEVGEDGDLDGIGSLFRDEFVVGTTTSEKTSKGGPSTGALGIGTSDTSSGTGGVQFAAMTPLDPSQWAYDSGDVIEQGAVILGGVEQEFGFGLRQQYFHKAAILVLDHSSTFTKGIILNRPTDLTLEDDINTGVKWRVWFGGDVEGLKARHPDIVCLHSLKNDKATRGSIPIMNDIQWTTFSNAKKLVKSGIADVSDFWVFVGYAGWGPGQLKGELERSSWYMVATDSQTLLKELARQTEGADPRDAGLDTWTLLMNMIGRRNTATEYSGGFDDLMLKEWALSNLLSAAAGGGAGRQLRDPEEFNTNPELVEQLLSLLDNRSNTPIEGALVRASAADRSPFLLEHQELHKSVVLVLKDDKLATVGVILNRPSAKAIDIKVEDKKSGKTKAVSIPMRFGGPYSVQSEQSLLWLHCSKALRDANIGSPVGDNEKDGIWKCTAHDVMKAVGQHMALPEEFLVISGVSVWPKEFEGAEQGMEGALELGKFEMVSSSGCEKVWDVLLKQQVVLTQSNFNEYLKTSEQVWSTADTGSATNKRNGKTKMPPPIGGLGENFDEEDDSVVFKSDYKVSLLSDDALRSWCATFLLGIHGFES